MRLIFDQRTIGRSFWFIRLRWIAISCLILISILLYTFSIEIQYAGILIVLIVLIAQNIISKTLLDKAIKSKRKDLSKYISKNIFYQIIIDLISLTALLNFSCSFENPLILFYTFHIVLSSIFLSKKTSYLIASIESGLLLLLAGLEYYNVIPHCSFGFYDYTSINEIYIASVLFFYSLSFFILVYLVSYISEKLKKQELSLYVTNSKIERINQELKRKDSIKDEYVSRLTHDIKGHLAAIQTNLSVVNDQLAGEIDEKSLKFINIAYNRTLKLTKFTQDLLRITKLRMKNETDKELVNLNNIIDNVIDHVKLTAQEKNITINLSTDNEVIGFCNHFSIEEVLFNLIINAIKYTPENGTIDVCAINKNEYAEIAVKDNGIGIPNEEIKNVFDDFFRASNVLNSKTEGTGLGLSLVWQIIERNNGKIWVESEENEGSKFIFSITSIE